jgi:hypothetical protein
MIDPSKITMLDDAFSSYLMDRNDTDFCNKASTILSALDQKKTFRVGLIHSTSTTRSKEPFFGMRIFPDRGFAEGLLQDMVNGDTVTIKDMCNRWQNIPIWEIEIDGRVFDQQAISFNPQELTAMVLHELGHTVYSDKKMEVFYRVYKEAQVRLKTSEKAATKLLYMLYLIPLTLVCGFKDWKIDEGDLRQEIFADQSVKKLGYGDHLISAYKKIIKAYGSGGYVNGATEENVVSRSIDFCNLNIVDLIHRKNKLKDELYSTGTSHNSNYIRKMISYLMSKLEIAQKRKYDGNIVLEAQTSVNFDDPDFLKNNELMYYPQGFNKLVNRLNVAKNIADTEVANEAFFKKKKEIEIPNQLDVDTIFVEVDRIQNHADRRYVLDLIYNEEEKINHFLELCEVNDTLKSKHYNNMQSMLRELEEMRKAVLAKRSFDKKYKVFVQYPAGYEG